MIRKFLLGAMALGLTSFALASGGLPVAPAPVVQDSGVYFGLEAGYANSGWKNLNFDGTIERINISTKDDGWAGRALLGYTFNKYFDVELGYLYMGTKSKFEVMAQDIVDVKTSAVDLLLKVKGPIADNFDLFAEFGAGYLMSKGTINQGSVNIVKQYIPGFLEMNGNDKKTSTVGIVYGLGADWHVTDNVIVDLGWKTYAGHHKLDKDYNPDLNFGYIGIKYFVPV